MRRRISNGLTIAALELGARPQAWRWVAGTLVMLLAGVCVSISVDNSIESGDYWNFSIAEICSFWLAGFVTGCVVRQWQAVLLALPPIVVAIPFGLPDGNTGFYLGNYPVYYDLAWLAPICAAFIAAGVIAAGTAEEPRRRMNSITALAVAAAALLSILGTAAFNPDDGFVLPSEPLWRASVAAAYVSWVALPLLVLVASMRLVLGWTMTAVSSRRSA